MNKEEYNYKIEELSNIKKNYYYNLKKAEYFKIEYYILKQQISNSFISNK